MKRKSKVKNKSKAKNHKKQSAISTMKEQSSAIKEQSSAIKEQSSAIKEQSIISAIKEHLSKKWFSIEELQKIYGSFTREELKSLLNKGILLKETFYYTKKDFIEKTFYCLAEEKVPPLILPLFLKMYDCEDIYNTCTELLSILEIQLQNNDDFKLITSDITYQQYVAFLIKKYGELSEPYFITNNKGNLVKNKNITKPGLQIHHIDENKISQLSDIDRAQRYPEYQGPDRLCYANDFEHGILHYLITKENLHSNLGIGGIVNYGLMSSYAQEKEDNLQVYYYVLCSLICLILKSPSSFLDSFKNEEDSEKAKLLFKTLSNARSHHFVFNGFVTNVFAQMNRITDIREQICDKYPVGISKITRQQGYELTSSKFALHYINIYVLRTSHDICAVVAQNSDKQNIVTFYGRTRSKTPWLKVSDFYEHMDEYWLRSYLSLFGVQQRLDILSKIVEQNGGRGHIHGTIIDIDCFNHLYYDISTNSVVGYTSSSSDWAMGRFVEFKPATELLPLYHNNLPALITRYNMILAPIQPMRVSMLSENLENQPFQIYKNNDKILKIQQQCATHMICSWDLNYNENFKWTGIKPDVKTLSQERKKLQITWKGE